MVDVCTAFDWVGANRLVREQTTIVVGREKPSGRVLVYNRR